MIEAWYSRLPRNDANDLWRFSRDTDACWTCMHFTTIDFVAFPLLCFSSISISPISERSPKRLPCSQSLKYWTSDVRKQEAVSMDTSRWASVVKHVWYGCPNEQNIAHQTPEQKKCFKLFDRMFGGLQILSNTTKHDQTAPNKVAKRWNVWSPNNVWWCLVTKHFPFGQALTCNIYFWGSR